MKDTMPALTPADLEILSAYLDNELDPAARADLERRLAAEPELRVELAALRAVVTRLHAAPLLRAPRDFRLDPAVYGRRPAITPIRRAYRWSSAVSALAAVIVLALGVAGVLTRSQIIPGASLTLQSAGREAESATTANDGVANAQPSAIALAPTSTMMPQATPSQVGAELEAPAEADTFAAPAALDAASEGGAAAGEPLTDTAQNAAESGFAAAAPPMTATPPGQSAGIAADSISPKETPDGLGGEAAGMVAPPMAAPPVAGQPQATLAVGEALAAQEEAEAPSVALSAPAASQATQDDALGQRLVATPTLEIAAAALSPTLPAPSPTPQPVSTHALAESPLPLPTPTLQSVPPPLAGTDESQARSAAAPAGIDPALLIGGGLGLLVLAGALYALSRR